MKQSKSETYTIRQGDVVGKLHIKDEKLDWVTLHREGYRAYTTTPLYSHEEIEDMMFIMFKIKELVKEA